MSSIAVSLSPDSAKPIFRLAAGIEYNGSGYCGWQSQVGVATVQDTLEAALSKVAAQPIRVITAGRTDTGVHALGQVVHFDTSSQRSDYAWMRGANTWLPHDVSVRWVKPVDASFNARFSARQRYYRYIILNRKSPAAILHQLVYVHFQRLEPELMHTAAQTLLGKHDFSAYRAASCQSKTALRELRQLSVGCSDDWIWIDAVADGFLHHMVRNLAGVLLRTGESLASPDWARQVLNGRDRRLGAITAPAQGLYLVRVDYDSRYQLPMTAAECRFW